MHASRCQTAWTRCMQMIWIISWRLSLLAAGIHSSGKQGCAFVTHANEIGYTHISHKCACTIHKPIGTNIFWDIAAIVVLMWCWRNDVMLEMVSNYTLMQNAIMWYIKYHLLLTWYNALHVSRTRYRLLTHICQGCLTDTGAMALLPQGQWGMPDPDGYEWP